MHNFSFKWILLMSFYPYVNSDCIMRDHCIEINGNLKPCPYNGSALPIAVNLDSEVKVKIMNLLKKRCPYLVYDEEGNFKSEREIFTCCEAFSFMKIMEPLYLADLVIGACKTCLHNYIRQICEMYCSPDQDRFLDVRTEMKNNVTYVNEINYRVHGDFMTATFDSCAGVKYQGVSAVKLMCLNAKTCDADSWFAMSGNTKNSVTPVTVNFIRSNNTADSMNARAFPCNESLNGGLPCSCMHCAASCPVGHTPELPISCSFYNVNCLSASIGISVFVLSVIILILIVWVDKRKVINNDDCKKESKKNPVIKIFEYIFSHIGLFSMSHPVVIILLTIILSFVMFYGFINVKLTTDPIELWSSPDSRSRQELNYFNEKFQPFYRTAQVFIKVKKENFKYRGDEYGPAFRFEAIHELIKIEESVFNIGKNDKNISLKDICITPLKKDRPNDIAFCVYMSASIYLGNKNKIGNETYLLKIRECLQNNIYLPECLATWGGGSIPELTFGGYLEDIYKADTLILTIPIQGSLSKTDLIPILNWEKNFLDTIEKYEQKDKPDFIDVSYSAARSIEDEIERTSRAEVLPMAISYILVFSYVILSLGSKRQLKTWFVDAKIFVAIASIFIVMLAIVCALGVMGYTGVPTTLLAINVIPFFLLSVGIDNVYLMINISQNIYKNLNSYDDFKTDFDSSQKKKFVFSKMLNRVGPAMFVSSITQIITFYIGTLAKFPAVKTFAIFSSLSLTFLFIFQITTMIAILSFDYDIVSKNKFGFLCCFNNIQDQTTSPENDWMKKVMTSYSRFLLNWRFKVLASFLFILATCLSIISLPNISIGLEEELAFPSYSYVSKYLKSLKEDLRIGPPVYFVVKSGLNFLDRNHQNLVCGGSWCDSESMVTQVTLASRFSNITYISNTYDYWLDDFVLWSSNDHCCQYNTTNNDFCPSYEISSVCKHCEIKVDRKSGLPTSESFQKYLPFFLQDEPTINCSKGGLAMHSNSVNYIVEEDQKIKILDTNYMAYHVPLSKSKDFINALKYAYELSKNITRVIQNKTSTDVEVFPYSVFYIFYEQYLTMWDDTLKSILYCLVCASVLNLIVSGFSVITTLAVMLCCAMLLINMMGVMYIWDISLNPISCVNLIISIGMSVEFCSHIAYEFNTFSGPASSRIKEAIVSVGPTIITGIFFTNIPIVVLAFSYTGFIRVFFFRMFFSIIVLGFLYGMVFLPILLSYIGGIAS